MYRLAVLLLVATCASASLAQPARPNSPTPPTAAPNQTGLTADGKIMLGLDGRGNYRKPRVSRNARGADAPTANPQIASTSAFRQALQAPQMAMQPGQQQPTSPPAFQQPPSPSVAPLAPTAMQSDAVAPVNPVSPVAPIAATASPATPNRPPAIANALPALQPNGGLYTDAMR